MCLDALPCLVLCCLLYAALANQSAVLRPRCPAQAGDRCQDTGDRASVSGDYVYKVDGHDVRIRYVEEAHFGMQCDNETRSVELPALPCFPHPVRVRTVQLWSCAPPSLPYARMLAALNITLTDALVFEDLLATPLLRDDHFEGLSSLERLELHSAPPDSTTTPHVPLPAALLAPLLALRNLHLVNVRPGTALDSVLPSLTSLQFWFKEANFVMPTSAPSLSLEQKVSIALVNVSSAQALRTLALSAPDWRVVGVTQLSSLRMLDIEYWSETRPEPWVECGALQHIRLRESASLQQTVLPGGWVSRCPVLWQLSILGVPLTPLPARLLQNATALTTLVLSKCYLAELPKDLFNDSVHLILLDLAHNRLETLPRDLFFPLRALKFLDLSDNLLSANAGAALQPLSSLTTLLLADNTRLSDLCDGGTDDVRTVAGPSPLQQMTGLTKLILRNSSVSRVCRDWRETMPHLKQLDLTETSIAVLKYDDMVQRRSTPGAKMRVSNRNGTAIRLEYSFEDFKRAQTEQFTSNDVEIVINAVVVCDCHAYWAELARNNSQHAGLRAPPCAGTGDSLRDMSPDIFIGHRRCFYL